MKINKDEKPIWIIKWKNKFDKELEFTHLYEHEVYSKGEAFINERKEIKVCRMN